MVLSLAIMAVLVVGISSAMVVATRAVDDRHDPAAWTRNAAGVISQLAAELRTAAAVLNPQQSSITVTADRNGQLEDIHYSWSGTPGAPLQRTDENGTTSVVVDHVQEFTLTYDLRDADGLGLFTPASGGEVLLASHNVPSDLANYSVSDVRWIGECFAPSLPPDALDWQVGRVTLRLRQKGAATGQITVQLRPVGFDDTPGSMVLGSAVVPESDLPLDYTFYSVGSFSPSMSPMAPDQGLCIVVQGDANDAAEAQFQNSHAFTPSAHMVTSASGGTVWAHPGAQALFFEAYGAATSGSNDSGLRYLAGVGIRLRCRDNSSVGIDTGVRTLNLPQWTGW